jgi:hypothetical protein
MAGTTADQVMSNLRASGALRRDGIEMWRIEKWVPPEMTPVRPIN